MHRLLAYNRPWLFDLVFNSIYQLIRFRFKYLTAKNRPDNNIYKVVLKRDENYIQRVWYLSSRNLPILKEVISPY
jgi:hypothetical protein